MLWIRKRTVNPSVLELLHPPDHGTFTGAGGTVPPMATGRVRTFGHTDTTLDFISSGEPDIRTDRTRRMMRMVHSNPPSQPLRNEMNQRSIQGLWIGE